MSSAHRSFTLTFQGTASELVSTFFPPIPLRTGAEIALLDVIVCNSRPNVDASNNTLRVRRLPGVQKRGANIDMYDDTVATGTGSVQIKSDAPSPLPDDAYDDVVIPVGSYEVSALARVLKSLVENLNPDYRFALHPNVNTFESELLCNRDISFAAPNSVGPLLGFERVELPANTLHRSGRLITIDPLTCIRITCNVAAGAFVNGVRSRAIYDFFPSVPPGFQIAESPRNLIYYPIATDRLDRVRVTITDQNSKLVDFRGEPITVRLHVRDGVGV